MLELDIGLRLSDVFALNIKAECSAPVTGILGPSGSGKSSLLACIAGLHKPQRGFVRLNGRLLSSAEQSVWVPPHKRRVGLVFQDGQLLPHLSVKQNLLYGYHHLLPAERRFEWQPVVELLEIESLLARAPRDLSGGEKQRVALGRAILYSPELLLLDEPLSALDERLKEQILLFIQNINRAFHIPMLYVTHARRELDILADDLWLMESGQLSPLSGTNA